MSRPLDAAEVAERPSRTRYGVVALLVALAMVTYLDRACIGTLAPWISADLGLSKDQMGWVFSAFALAYAAFEIPTASWADRRGTRLVLTRIVIWWSSFTIATAAAVGHGSLLVIRFLFGIGEAGAWPTAARSFSRWIPSRERGTVQGIFFAGAHLAGGLTPPLVLLLMQFPALALDLHPVRFGRLPVGRLLVRLVSRRAGATPAGQRGRTGADRRRTSAPGQSQCGLGLLAAAVRKPQRPGPLPDVFPQQLRLLLLPDLAAHVPQGATRLRGRGPGVAGRLAGDLERRGRPAGRRDDRLERRPVRPAAGPLRGGRRGVSAGGCGHAVGRRCRRIRSWRL